MIHQMFVAKSGMFAYQRKMQTITANIANAQTVGFKTARLELESLFPLIIERAITEFEDDNIPINQKKRRYIQYGHGVRVADVIKDFSQGTIEVTNQPLDLAIEGRGFLQFRLPDGTFAYSRAGNLHMDHEGNILNPNGHPMEPAIRIPQNTTDISITEEGRVFVQINGEAIPQEVGQLVLADFPNPAGLKEIGQNLYTETAASGEALFDNPGRNAMGNIRQRALEFSNVDIINELMSMVLTQRNFELIVKSLNAGDAMLKTASDIGK